MAVCLPWMLQKCKWLKQVSLETLDINLSNQTLGQILIHHLPKWIFLSPNSSANLQTGMFLFLEWTMYNLHSLEANLKTNLES